MNRLIKLLTYILIFFLIFSIKSNAIVTEFTKYNLTEDQLIQIANLCQQEQGDARGASAEASLMANRFELKGAKYGTGADGLVNYVRTSKWFYRAIYFMDNGPEGGLREDVKNAVRSVLVDGKRTLPAYVDEHDSVADIQYVTNNGITISKRNPLEYIPHISIIHQAASVGSGTWTYYGHPKPVEGSDPFGYTSEENRTRLGEFHYDFDGSAVEYTAKNTGIGGELGGRLDDPFKTFPSLIANTEFTCKTIFYYKDDNGVEQETTLKKFMDGVFKVMQIAAPIIAISLSITEYTRVITNSDESSLKKANIKTLKRIAIAIIILLLPILLNLLFALFGLYDLSTCT